jgi:hypothetical protein
VARDAPAAVGTLGGGHGEQQWDVVARFAVQRAEDVAGGGPLEDEPARLVTLAQQVGGQSGPVAVHVDCKGGRGRHVGQLAQHARVLTQVQAAAPKLGGHRGQKEARVLELLPVLVEEPVLPVVDRRPLVEPGEHLPRQQLLNHRGHRCPPCITASGECRRHREPSPARDPLVGLSVRPPPADEGRCLPRRRDAVCRRVAHASRSQEGPAPSIPAGFRASLPSLHDPFAGSRATGPRTNRQSFAADAPRMLLPRSEPNVPSASGDRAHAGVQRASPGDIQQL